MPKYINTDELLETLGCAPVTMSVCLNVDECKGRIYERERVLRIIKDIPAADVEPVVRCQDCKHYNAGFECLIEGYGIERPADYFCADGKREDGGQDDG